MKLFAALSQRAAAKEAGCRIGGGYVQLECTVSEGWQDRWQASQKVLSKSRFSLMLLMKAPVSNTNKVRFHSDPFDKAIVASSLQLGLTLLTNDSVIHHEKPCKLFWD